MSVSRYNLGSGDDILLTDDGSATLLDVYQFGRSGSQRAIIYPVEAIDLGIDLIGLGLLTGGKEATDGHELRMAKQILELAAQLVANARPRAAALDPVTQPLHNAARLAHGAFIQDRGYPLDTSGLDDVGRARFKK